MSNSQMRPAIGGMFYYVLALTLGAYFTFAAVQGDYGVFRRVQISAEAQNLIAERDQLVAELAEIEKEGQALDGLHAVGRPIEE